MRTIPFLALIIFISCQNSTNLDRQSVVEDSLRRERLDSVKLVREIETEAKPAYIEAYEAVQDMKDKIRLSEQGLIRRSDVIDDFNQTLGREMGRLSSLSQIKERLDTAGDAYIQFKFKKACANVAMEKAASLKFEFNR